jgi:hypothetical protein
MQRWALFATETIVGFMLNLWKNDLLGRPDQSLPVRSRTRMISTDMVTTVNKKELPIAPLSPDFKVLQ